MPPTDEPVHHPFGDLTAKVLGVFLVTEIFMLSLGGIPPTAGFMGKVYVFGAALEANLVALTIVGVLNSVVSIYYYFLIAHRMFFREPGDETREGPPARDREHDRVGPRRAGFELLGQLDRDARIDLLKGAHYRDRDKAARRGTEVHALGEDLAHVQVLDTHVHAPGEAQHAVGDAPAALHRAQARLDIEGAGVVLVDPGQTGRELPVEAFLADAQVPELGQDAVELVVGGRHPASFVAASPPAHG